MVSVGSVQFQIAPRPSLHFSISTAPSGVAGVTYRAFSLLHQSLLKRFPLFIWLLFARPLECPTSALTQAGGGGLLFRLLVPSRCGEGLVLLSPLRYSGSRLLYMERALHCMRFQPSGAPQKRGTKSCACFLCLPSSSGSGSQELHGRTLPGRAFSPPRSQPQFPPAPVGCGVPFRLRVPSPSPCPLWLGACTLCLAMTLPADVMLSCSFCLFCSFVCTGLSLGLWDLFP